MQRRERGRDVERERERERESKRAHYDNWTQARELFNEIKNNLINLTVTHVVLPTATTATLERCA